MTSSRENEKRDFISQFLVIAGSTIVNVVISFFLTPLITRLVDPEEYGMMSMFNLYANIGLMVLCLGLDQALIRFFYEKDDNKSQSSLVRFCFLTPIASTILVSVVYCVAISTGILNIEFSLFARVLLPIHVAISIWNRIAGMVLRVTYDSKSYAFCIVLGRVIYAILIVLFLCVFQNRNINSLVICTVLTALVGAIASTVLGKNFWRWRNLPAVQNKKEILKYSFPFILSMGVTNILEAADKFALQSFCSYTELGVYQSALSITGVFALVQTAFNTLWSPIQTEHFVKNPDDTSFIRKGNQYITVVMFLFGIHVILFKDIIILLLGEKYRGASTILPFLVLHPIMYTISETTCSGIDKSKKTYLNIVVALCSGVFNVIGNLLLVPVLGPKGAAISTGLSYVIFFAVRTVLSNRYYYIDYHISKLIVILGFTILFATISTFMRFGLWTILGYLLCVSSVLILYWTPTKELMHLGMQFAKAKLRKER